MQSIVTSIILDTRRALKDGTFPVKLRVTFQRKQKYYPTEFSFTPENFEKLMSLKPGKFLKEDKLKIQAAEQKINQIIQKLPHFSFNELDRRLLKNSSRHEAFSSYEEAIARLKEEGRLGNAGFFESARNSLWCYVHGAPFTKIKGTTKKKIAALMKSRAQYQPLPFTEITVQFLKDYEKWMRKGGRSITTVGMYLRTLRTLFNDAIAAGDVSAELYPFGKRKYQIPSGVNIKKALSMAEIAKIFSYTPTSESEARCRDLWIFSYLCNGINVKDIARLQYRQIDKDTVTFTRAKTEHANRHQSRAIVAILSPQALKIIKKWGNKPRKSDSYVFPILRPGLTAEQEQANIKQAIKNINTYMARIAEAVGIEKKVTTYTARHSFSTVLKRAGVSTSFISESLGHADEKTTQNYLDSFETEAKRQVISKLTAFEELALKT